MEVDLSTTSTDPAPPDQGMAENGDERLAAHYVKRTQQLAFNTQQLPRLRLFGFATLCALLLIYNELVTGGASFGRWLPFTIAAFAYSLLSWLVLWRYWARVRGLDLGLVSLGLDIPMFTWGLWVSGGYHSWLLFLLLVRVADQTNTTRRRVLAFLHVSMACYVVMVIGQAWADPRPPVLRTELAKVLTVYLVGLYVASTTKVAERMRHRLERALRFARSTARDLSEQAVELNRARAAAEAAARAKASLMANVGHEVRTPLAGMLGLTRLALETEVSPEVRANLTLANQSGEQLLHLIEQVMELAAGDVTPSQQPFEPRLLVTEVAERYASPAATKGLELDVEVDPLVPLVLQGDRERLGKILRNLMENAIKFTPRGSVLLTARVTERSPTETWLEIGVLDTGIGISEAKKDQVFEAFTQVNAAPNRPAGGAGLGLTVCRHLANLLGGRLTIESYPGEGTAVRLAVPMRLPPAAPVSDRASEATAAGSL
jgi:signal transduction histidine kinase